MLLSVVFLLMLISSVTIILYLNYLAAKFKRESNTPIIIQAFKETLEDSGLKSVDEEVYVEAC